MGMDDLMRRPQAPKELPFEMRFGEAQNPTMCQSCKVDRRAGFYVIYKGYAVLVCVQCTATAIMKYQASIGLPPDGFASASVLDRLRGQ